ncbi:cell division cycle-associated protein 2 [Prinia subflava]|uniref:cell division cycle-associated protein 2 n=1 Tax=Prinia subflava TaxID=208062 RepID=UPI002FDF6D27
MLRGSKAPLKVKENESGCPEQKEETSLLPSRDQKSCKVTKSKVMRASKKENFTAGNQTRPPKHALRWPEGPEENLCPRQGCAGGWQLPGHCFGVLSEAPVPLHTREGFSSSRAVPLGRDFSTPDRNREEGKADSGLCEQREKPAGFVAELGMAQEGSGKRLTGTSPTPPKSRGKRSRVGLGGSPENTCQTCCLVHQRSSRPREPLSQISPFNPAPVRLWKEKIDTFQACFGALQEAEGELRKPSQEGVSCAPCDAGSDLTPGRAGLGEGASLAELGDSQAPLTPLGAGDTPSCVAQSSSLLTSILKKSSGKELGVSPKKHLDSAINRGGESAAGSGSVKEFGTPQTETPRSQGSKTANKRVTFGQVLSPELLDQSLPANTPLHRGASPGCPAGHRPRAGPALPPEPLPRLDFTCNEESVEPLPELLEGSVAAEAPSPAQSAEVAKPVSTAHATKRKGGAVTEGTEGDPSPSLRRSQRVEEKRRKILTAPAPTEAQKTKYPSFERRRKKKVKKSLYGERETASKKPLLSPIPEIPENFFFVSSPNSPKTDAPFTEAAALEDAGAAALCPGPLEEAAGTSPEGPGSLEEAAGTSPEVPGSLQGTTTTAEFLNAVPDAEGDFDTPEYFHQGKETLRAKEAEKQELEGNLLRGLELLEQQDAQESAQRTKPQKDSVRGDPARRRRSRRSSSAFYHLPPAENLEISGAEVAVCSSSVEEALSVPRAEEGALQGRRRSSSSAELRVRRSLRLSRDAASEGLAWIQLPGQPPLPARARRSSSASVLAAAENFHHRQQNLPALPAPGKENQGTAGPGRRRRRRSSLLEATTREMPWAHTQRRRSTNSACGRDRSDQKHSAAAETLELRWEDVPGIPAFLS